MTKAAECSFAQIVTFVQTGKQRDIKALAYLENLKKRISNDERVA